MCGNKVVFLVKVYNLSNLSINVLHIEKLYETNLKTAFSFFNN